MICPLDCADVGSAKRRVLKFEGSFFVFSMQALCLVNSSLRMNLGAPS